MSWVSDDEFWHKHALWHRSPAAQEIRRRLRVKQKNRCARCGLRYLTKGYSPARLQLNLTRYKTVTGRLVFDTGVKDGWCNLLCPDHHPKGTYTWQKLAADRMTDRWVRVLEWPFALLWRLVKWLFRR